MKAMYWQKGETIDYVNSTADIIEANAVVKVGNKIGVAGAPILPGGSGSLHTEGVFKMTKDSAEAIEVGITVYFTGAVITATASGNTLAGYTVKAAKAGETDIFVKLQG